MDYDCGKSVRLCGEPVRLGNPNHNNPKNPNILHNLTAGFSLFGIGSGNIMVAQMVPRGYVLLGCLLLRGLFEL